jgi:pimeloyl-ACP methyl ester carboxylesterase
VKSLAALLALAAAAAPSAFLAAAAAPGLHTDVVLTKSSPLVNTAELVRRTFSPLYAERLAAAHSLAGQPINIAQEKFLIYVPPRKPPQGYALLVFVPPTEITKVPSGWAPVLDDKGVIFVSAAHSGNDTKVESRRIPLAVTAAEQLVHDYAVDPSRVLVGGFSGGSRVALRVALAYPDVFRGALLNSDSDPIGTTAIPLPPPDLFRRFQENSRVFYITGDLDPVARSMQAGSETSLQSWCVFDVHATPMPHAGHTTADERTLSLALDTLLDPAPAKHDGLAECRARVQSELAAAVQRVEALIASGDKSGARQALADLDTRFGGLAAAEILRLSNKLK